MFIQSFQSNLKKSHILFAVGFCLVIIAGWIHIFPGIRTFMFTWRVELAASIFIALVSSYLLYTQTSTFSDFKFSTLEKYLIILPVTAFILWSGCSIFWALSSQSALHHTAIWSQYLVFYLVARQLIDYNGNYKLLMTLLTILLLMVGIPAIIEYGSFLYLNAGTTLGIRFSKYAEIVNLLCPLLIAAVLRMNGRRFIVGILCVAVMWLFIISTLSRTGFILFIAGVAMITVTVFVFTQFKKYRRKMAVLVLILVISPIPLHLIAFLSTNPNIPLLSRVNDSVGMSNSNNSRKMLASVALEMIKSNPVTGVGADNFGVELNNYRAVYGEKNPDDVNLATSEDEIAERAHNEYLQITSELGVIGLLIFLCFLLSIAVMAVNLFKRRNRASLFPFAALCGILLFLISSAVSSYSFRLMQNGFVFLFVLAVSSKFLLADKQPSTKNNKIAFDNYFYKAVLSFGILSCLLLGTHCILRAASSYYSAELLNLSDSAAALPLYENAVRYDDENPRSHLGYGLYLINEKRYREAIPQLNKTIELGEGTSADYSLLATSQFLSGDVKAATETCAEAVKLYPRSTFVRTRYAALLQESGNEAGSRKQLEISSSIDIKSTKTWWSLMHEGVAKTNIKTLKDKDYIVVFDLQPQIAYTAVMIERLILHPEEKPKIKLTAAD